MSASDDKTLKVNLEFLHLLESMIFRALSLTRVLNSDLGAKLRQMPENAEGALELRLLLQLQPAVKPRRLRLLRRVCPHLGRENR